ncbi:helix-turn-helix domain-containing protein [Alkaliphilus transvaalensis]|uniref:helix-turn-helix domain-containing protein n=1 Tax=Alkaliphilus transvaalensis TaxID=114628 RepID=UPI00047DDEA7|nr:tetratricopeptide repeat protein [Alkaliphilus transvaalensis]
MEILSPGKKIKILRKKIGLRQDQLTDARITRSLISMIENGKRRLNRKTAMIIAVKLNDYYKNLGQEITPEYLLESEEKQASNIIEENIESLRPILKNKKEVDHQHVFEILKSMIELAEKWNLPDKKAEILLVRGKYYFDKKQFNLAIADYYNSLEYYLSSKEEAKIALLYVKISKCYIFMAQFDQAAFYGEKAFSLSRESKISNSNEIKAKALLNKIICYYRTNRYDLTLQEIEKFKNIKYVNESLNDEVTLLEANTFYSLKNYEKARKIYERLLNREGKVELHVMLPVYDHIAKLYSKIGELSKAREILQRAILQRERIADEEYLATFLLEIAKCYYGINDHEGVLKLLSEIMLISEQEILREADLADTYILAAKIYLGRQNYNEAEEYLLKSQYYLEKDSISEKLNEVYSLLGELYCDLGNINATKVYFQKIRNN